MESEFAVESCVRGTTSIKNLWDACAGEELRASHGYAVAVMRRSAIVGHVPRKISAACSLSWPISCLLAISGRSETEVVPYYSIMSARASWSVATRPRPKYWRNLIWRCVHNPPNHLLASYPGGLGTRLDACTKLPQTLYLNVRIWSHKWTLEVIAYHA